MKKIGLILSIVLLPFASFANDEKLIETTMKDYWSAWTGQDLKKAATYIAPQDLEKGKDALLPVFLEAQENKAEDIQQLVGLFFGEAKGEDRKKLSGEDVFMGINRVVFVFMGDAVDMLSKSSIEVTSFTPDGDKEVMIRYGMKSGGEMLAEDFERLIKHEGKWYLRYKEDPAITARNFKEIFNK